MKFIKKNIKIIIGFIIGTILASGVTVYATYKYFATDVSYTKDGTEISVSDALNELYQNKKETTDSTKEITTNGEQTLDKYYKNLNVNVPIPQEYIKPSGTAAITEKGSQIDVSNFQYADTTGLYTADEVQSGKGIHWNTGSFTSIAGINSINVGFVPSKIVITYSHNGCSALYNSALSTTGSYSYRPSTVTFVNLNSQITEYFNIRTIGSTTTMYIGTAGITMFWFATE